MRAYDIILKKRNGGKLSKEEIEFMVNGYVKGEVPDYQMAAFLMAIYFRHMDPEERAILTEVMANSGDRIDLSSIPGIKIDKHSTGGVGDKTTLVVGPIVASLGVPVAKMSGRALGHTGGTIDKLESIPGFRTSLSEEEFFENVRKIGIAIVGQTANLVPADKKIYALRDATATVDEVSLIASSIMSKKLAGGADGYVLDVKVGSGAFMKTIEQATELAEAMVGIAKAHGKKAVAVLTNMDVPLGKMVGNSLEVLEAIETLKGRGPEDFTELCLNLAAWMCHLAEKGTFEECLAMAKESLESGKALEKFRQLVEYQGGNPEVVDRPTEILPLTDKTVDFIAPQNGYITAIDTEKIGIASNYLGAGRKTKEDTIDYRVGIEILKKLGDCVKKGEPIAKLYISDKSDVESALKLLSESYKFSDQKPEHKPIILGIVK
ncbi:pyrimidine-nucleoside phosphorylase [Fervidobacterium pennivorans DSM 9078]|jgi:pyrimidine-nucleoside phosphorylase|uniref:Pyrimidine-nucleoside phosphorylase n=1 Tax=Fervidobacterium pennivorans (strain DSM 9078 / Ven5) TaxID=771875 RepID=H9U9Q1_FERPD|nr:pyrimidine-nucleoside phosphorylase [Fervidobacterium pennivorans]AFG34244.1 pyrimidine-nucleoside phosphorylase [Fervidobacterium pennivorans DSM 9078]QIV77613.1 pyrimidine-nucleoside phosphorylase [Fervidobacterium pennivorans subsp. keratinolyticus]